MSPRKRLLVVDDVADFAAFVAKVAGDLGYAAVATSSVDQFRVEYLASPPDVIVLDIVMPGQDGIEMMKWLVDRGCRARIVIISGYSPTYAKLAQVIGEHGSLEISQLQKPVKLAELRARLAEGLSADRAP